MDLLPAIAKHLSSRQKVVFSGTDPGTVVTSVTVPMTLESVFASINRFEILASAKDSSEDNAPCTFNVDRLPKPYKITASLINNVTFLKKHQKKWQRQEKTGIDKETQRKKRAKDNREREVRTKRAYGKITAQECRHIRAHAQLPPDAPAPALIHCIGHWQGINSFIKGHSRRGMKRIRAQHRVYGNVAITNEHNSSKTCPFCFSKVILHRARRIVRENERVVRLHGAIECVHPKCPARRIKYTTRGRDANAAANIALSGASIILSSDRQPLPPFHRNANHTRYNLAKDILSVMTPALVPRDSTREE